MNLPKSLDLTFWRDRNVLLTGHTGFKGSWLALWLSELGAKVTGLALEPQPDPSLFRSLELPDRINHEIVDITNSQYLMDAVLKASPDVVFHLAAQPLVSVGYLEPSRTWNVNVVGTVNLLEALRRLDKSCSAVMITTDKVYENREWLYGYRETDPLGGYDPYSSSKAASELAIQSWRSSFCGLMSHQTSNLNLASARAGNVIGGGDWAKNRIVPDIVRALSKQSIITIRNPSSTRPWQHVLEPLSGYMRLAEMLYKSESFATAYNFGPSLDSNRSVSELVSEVLVHWPGHWIDGSRTDMPHEASRLNLVTDRAYHELNWKPCWDFSTTVYRTVKWYRRFLEENVSAMECCLDDLTDYQTICTS